jgi:hypothetical protein
VKQGDEPLNEFRVMLDPMELTQKDYVMVIEL